MPLRGSIFILALALFPPDIYATQLIRAAKSGRTERVEEFLRDSSNRDRINSLDRKGQSALMYAAKDGNSEAVRLILGAGADPDARGDTRRHPGQYPLAWAAEKGNLDIVRRLIRAGADPNSQTRVPKREERNHPMGDFPLSRAAYRRHRDVVEFLLENGGKPGLFRNTPHGASPMYWAILSEDPTIVRMMIGAMPDPAAPVYREGQNAIDTAELFVRDPQALKDILAVLRAAVATQASQ